MTVTARVLSLPKLRTKDSNCLISWFEGAEAYSGTATTGDYPNLGSLGDEVNLRLSTESAYVRRPAPGFIPGTNAQWLAPSYLPHGLSTPETTLGESSSAFTFEGWVRPGPYTGAQHILVKMALTGGDPIRSPYGYLFRISPSGLLVCYLATHSGNYTGVLSSASPLVAAWNHVAFTLVHDSTATLYLNGSAVYSAGPYPIFWGDHGRWAVGGWGGRSGMNLEGFNGALQGIRVHSVARDAAWMRETVAIGAGVLP